jgi:hypothetical protein
MRNKQLLTDKENERMFVDIVESIVGKRVDLRYTSKPIAKVESFGEYHAITLGKIKGIDRFTLLNHEAGHILFNSPTKSAEDMITEWAEDWKAGAFIPLDLIKKTYWYALNILEDQRIESLMSKLYLYNKKRFYKAKLNVSKDMVFDPNVYSPLHALYCLRFLREDLSGVENFHWHEEYEVAGKILREVEGTGQRGALIGLAKFKPFIDKHIYYKINIQYPRQLDDWEKEVESNSLDYDEVGRVDVLDLGSMEEARKGGEREIEYMKEALSNVDINKMSSHDVIENDGEEYNVVGGEPIQEIVNDMSNMFRNMNEMPKTTIGYEGDEVDIESYIKNKVEGHDVSKCLVDTKYVQGISILVAVDGSSSMEDGSHSSITRARDMVATMYKAIENVNNIDLMSIVWSADVMGKMNVTRIRSLEDTKKIHTSVKYPTTPTHMAIEYSTKMMKRMKGRTKLLIFITDGQPEYMKGGTLLPTQTLVKMCVNAMIKGMRRCDSMVVLLIKPSDFSQKCSEDIFGKRLIVADDMKSGSDIIMNKFKHLVMGVLK